MTVGAVVLLAVIVGVPTGLYGWALWVDRHAPVGKTNPN